MKTNIRHKRPLSIAAAIALACLASGNAAAAPPAGRLLAAQCAQCHGTGGSGRGFDELAGESAQELYSELREMKFHTRIESIMDRQARGYTDQQLRAIADYFASLPGGGH
ncbi:MAG: c-type cytochrome [Gammaproteobacteria bacterium]|nr:c-type cytochrome [Gammaproteobacteria bacterium]